MQPTEAFSTPRRTLDVEDYIDILRRHKGWIFGPFLFAVVASVVGVYLWPDTYISTAMVKITPQQIPENLVPSSINQQMFDRINSMEQDVLSRTSLTTIINTFNLYTRERNRLPLDDVIEQMRKKIQVDMVAPANSGNNRSIPAFAVAFSYSDPHAAQRVVQDLVTRFIDENQRNRSNQTYQTTRFMQDELDQAKKDLETAENKLTAFRVQNNGRLPDQVDGNMRTLQALSTQASTLDMNISRATQEKLQLETRLRIATDQLTDLNKQQPESAAVATEQNQRLAEADQQIQRLEDFVRALRQKYTDTNPDVQTALAQLSAARQKREDILKEDAATAKKDAKAPPTPLPDNPVLAKEKRDLDASVRQLQSAIQAKDLEIADYNKEMQRDNDAMKSYQSRVEAMPLGQKEYTDLTRDDSLAKDRVVQLTQRLEKAQVAQNMEDQKEGEMLELLDPASLPISPTQPNRPLVIAIGAAVGFLLGIVIAGAREMKDTSLKNLKDVRAYTQMAILGSIPLLENDFVVRRRKRLAWLGWTTACLAAAVVMAGAVVYYEVTKGGA